MNIAIPTNTSVTVPLARPKRRSKNREKLKSGEHTSTASAGSIALFNKTTGSTLHLGITTASTSKIQPPSQEFEEASDEEVMEAFYKLEPRYAQLYRDLADL